MYLLNVSSNPSECPGGISSPTWGSNAREAPGMCFMKLMGLVMPPRETSQSKQAGSHHPKSEVEGLAFGMRPQNAHFLGEEMEAWGQDVAC